MKHTNELKRRQIEVALPYRFNDSEREIIFKRHDMPGAWINYLSNGSLHAFVSQAGGGLLWWKSPMIFRLTRYRMYNLPIDSPGFYVYIRENNGTIWSPTFRPCETPLDSWQSSHRPGKSIFKALKNSIEATLTLFMSQEYDTMIWDLKLRNKGIEKKDFDVFAYVELSQFMYVEEVKLGYYFKWAERVEYNSNMDSITYINNLDIQPRMKDSPLLFFATDKKVDSYSCSRDAFCGPYRFERNPIAVEKGRCDNENLRGGEGCAALHIKQSLKTEEEISVPFFLGVTRGVLNNLDKAREETAEKLAAFRRQGFVEYQMSKSDKWWEEELSVIQCDIPDADAQRQINIWNPVQSVHTARYSRSISSSASGDRGIGYRDTCQDMLTQAVRRPEWARKMLIHQASMQFEEGYVVQQSWPEERHKPEIATRSDNHLWLTELAYTLVVETGDYSILDIEVPFLDKDLVSSAGSASIWEHFMRGIEFTENNMGSHNLPLILISDWNDHVGSFGRENRGETIFVAQQHIYYMKMLIELAEARNDKKSIEWLTMLIEKQQKAINDYAWESDWWLRGYDDNGEPFGSKSDKHGRIWLETQVWAVMSQTGPVEKLKKAMDSAKEYLDSDIGMQILSPGYPTWPEVDKPAIKFLPPGCAENAGIFCHVNAWAVIAECILGRADRAWKYYKQLIPHVAAQKVGIEKYIAEPYAYVSTIFGPENVRHGWANVTQVTGTAAWMELAAIKYILGLRPNTKGMVIDPCIPAEWEGFKAVRKFRDCEIKIKVRNRNGVQKGIKVLTVDGRPIDISKGALIPMDEIIGRSKIFVEAIMG